MAFGLGSGGDGRRVWCMIHRAGEGGNCGRAWRRPPPLPVAVSVSRVRDVFDEGSNTSHPAAALVVADN